MPARRIRVLCVDDHRIVGEGIALIVNRQWDMEVVALASSGEEAVQVHRERQPDVTLMDLQLGAMSGVEAVRTIRAEAAGARIVVLAMDPGDEDIYRALDAGAAACLAKDASPDDLIRAVRDAHSGRRAIGPEMQARLAERAAGPRLTGRELQVLKLVAEGMANKAIASALGISEETAQVHVKHILSKLKVTHRSAAVAVALRRGIIHLS
jgi:two-component system NarL family response regulator